MKRAIAILMLSVWCACGQGFDGASLTGTNINLAGQSDWGYYGGSDAPGGAYIHASTGATNIQAIITLPTSLAAGIWRFQLKVTDYDRYSIADVVLAGVTNTAQCSDRDGTLWFSSGVNITNSYGTNTLLIYFHTTNNLQLLMSAIYWTTNLNEDVGNNSSDLIVNYTYPSTVSTSVDNTNNVIAVSSFECGMAPWRVSMNNKSESVTNWISYTDAQHGVASLRFAEVNATIYSPYFWPKPDSRYYTISCYWKGSGSIMLDTPITANTNYTATISTNKTLPSVGSWTRTNFVVALRDYPARVPYRIVLGGASNTLFDAIMVHEGTNLATFAQMDAMELGWSNTVPSSVYYSNNAATPYVVVHNSSGSNRAVTVYYEFVNYWNEIESSGSFSTTLADGAKSATSISLPANVGWYRVSAWADGIRPQEQTLIYMPDPGTSQEDFVGTHNFGRIWQIRGMERTGISQTRAMSPQAMFRWSLAEVTDDVFTYDDQSVTNTINNNTKIIGTLGMHSGHDVPAYAGGDVSTLDLAQWSNHVYTMVGHYKTWVTNWEIWNEPTQGGITAAQYTNILKTASLAAKAQDSNAYIIAIGGSGTASFVSNVLDSFGTAWTNYADAISLHGYPEASDPFSSGPALSQAAAWKASIVDGYATPNNRPIWNTESGHFDFGGKQADARYPQIGGGIYLYQHNSVYENALVKIPWQVVQHALAYKAYGFGKYFYYDSRNFTDWIAGHYQSWEGDDTHRPKLAALAVVNAMVAGTTGGGVIIPTANNKIVFLYFDNGNNSVAAAWSTNAAYYTITLTNAIPYDHFGRPKTVASDQFSVGRMPVYIKPVGLTTAQFKTALTNAGVATLADTRAPGLSVFLFPGKTINDTNRFQARWSAVDELSLPAENNQSDILTRAKISTDSDYNSWSTSTERIWTNVSPNLTLTVQAKDAAGNISTQTREFGSQTSLTATTVNVQNLIIIGP